MASKCKHKNCYNRPVDKDTESPYPFHNFTDWKRAYMLLHITSVHQLKLYSIKDVLGLHMNVCLTTVEPSVFWGFFIHKKLPNSINRVGKSTNRANWLKQTFWRRSIAKKKVLQYVIATSVKKLLLNDWNKYLWLKSPLISCLCYPFVSYKLFLLF